MKAHILLITSFLLTSSGQAQKSSEMANWLYKEAIEINSINPSDTSFSDLAKWKESLKNVRIVMLGEQDHGDGAAFLAKTRLIKYLHEQLGYNVLAFETGFYDMYRLNSTFQNSSDFTTIVKQNIQPVWSKSKETQPLFDYIKTQKERGSPLFLDGFDCSNVSSLYKEQFANDLNKIITKYRLRVLETSNYKVFLMRLKEFTNSKWSELISGFNPKARLMMYHMVDTIKNGLEAIPNTNDTELTFWLQEIEALKTDMKVVWDYNIKTQAGYVFNNTRDKQMAKNLIWLAHEKYPEEKIIVWSHNYHVLKNPELIHQSKYFKSTKLNIMGDIVSKKMGDKVYHLGFVSSGGEFYSSGHRSGIITIPHPSKRSLEFQLNRIDYDNAIITFKGKSYLPNFLNREFNMRGISHFLELKGNWTRTFDGVFYIKKMTPSHKITSPKK